MSLRETPFKRLSVRIGVVGRGLIFDACFVLLLCYHYRKAILWRICNLRAYGQ